MDIGLWTALIGIAAGAFSYWFTTFSMQPILRFLKIRNQILVDFVYFAQVIKADGLNEEMQELHRQRILANRKASAELRAAVLDLPFWYRFYLKFRGYNPEKAAKHLIGFSNTYDYEESHKLEDAIRSALRLPPTE